MAEQRTPSPKLAVTLAIVPFLLWVLAEIALLVWLSQAIGWWTILALLATSGIGVLLMLRQGKQSLEAMRRSMTAGVHLATDVGDASLRFIGAMLLVLPGFLSDLVGALFVLPFTRPLVKGTFARLAGWAERRSTERVRAESGVIDGEVVDDAPNTDDGPLVIEGTVIDDEERAQ